MEKFKAVVLEKVELEIRDMSELKSVLPPLASQKSHSDVDINF